MKQIAILLFLFISHSLTAQSYKYTIQLLGKEIGTGNGSKTVGNNGATIYSLKTHAEAKVMFKDKVNDTSIKVVSKNGLLQSCVLDKTEDGVKQHVEIKYENGKHYYYENGKKTAVPKLIKYTTTEMFYKEPKGISEVFVERLNVFVPIVKVEEGLYKTEIDGASNYYKYKNGEMIEFHLKKIINVYMYKV
ncbi:MAG: hypothetical protein LRY27_01815 [Chitinophagales bacterium]|nr:hypothetical protein [Chitinophagales bacterium]